jgi:hypothetical protein
MNRDFCSLSDSSFLLLGFCLQQSTLAKSLILALQLGFLMQERLVTERHGTLP